jgi:hypothetical protein
LTHLGFEVFFMGDPSVHRVSGLFRADRRLAERGGTSPVAVAPARTTGPRRSHQGIGRFEEVAVDWLRERQERRNRVIYYLWRGDTAFLLFAYPKNQQEDLTPAQARLLKDLINAYTDE